MNSIIGLGVSMSLAPFVCWERDGIAQGRIDGKGLGGEAEKGRGGWEEVKGENTNGGRREGKESVRTRCLSERFERQINSTWNYSVKKKKKTKQEKKKKTPTNLIIQEAKI